MTSFNGDEGKWIEMTDRIIGSASTLDQLAG